MPERAELVWKGGRDIEARIRDLVVVHDKPVEKGYTNRGPTPSEMFLASLASCTMMSTLRVAEVRKVAVEALSASAELDFDAQDRVSGVRVEFRVASPAGLKDWEVIARLAGKFCTIEQLTKPPVSKRFVLNGKDTIEVEKAH
jgi:putative redox protein